MTPLKKIRLLATFLISAAVYALVAYFCLHLAFKGTNASPVWPPSGLAFIAVWFWGYSIWPAISLGALAANTAAFLYQGWSWSPSLVVSLFIAVGNSLEALIAVYILKRLTKKAAHLDRIKDVFKFVAAVLAACSFSATIGTCAVYFIHPHPAPPFDEAWITWWLGDIVGILVIASGFLTFKPKAWRLYSWQNAFEALLITAALITVNICVFMGKFPTHGYYFHVTYLILPFAIWATFRFGFPGATFSYWISSLVAVLGSIYHLGPFGALRVPEDLLIIQCFIGVITVTVLVLAAALREREQAQEDVRYNEARFRSLVENSFEVVALVDKEAKIVYTSPSTKTLLGYDTSSMIGHSMFEWMHPDDAPSVLEIFKGLLVKQGAIAHATCRMQRKDGVWRWMEGSGHNLLHDSAIEAIVINYRDITDRKLSQEHFEQVVEHSPVAKIIVNKQGAIKMVNKMTEKLFAYSREELLTMNIDSLIPEEFRESDLFYSKDIYKPLQTKAAEREKEICILRSDGRQVPVELRLTLIETEEGLCFLTSMLDITQRKRAEEILRRDKESLEKLVDERSKELIKTQKELKQFSRLADIGTLAATVAHELRNPLGVIQLAAYNLKREKGDLLNNRHLVNIEKKVWEGNQIIDNLLSYARIKIPNHENVRIVQALDECVTSVQGRFIEKRIVIEKHYGPGLDLIEADPNQLREIFLNILNNACQSYADPGGRVSLSAAIQGEMLEVTVKDNGMGIAAEDLDKVFEPFFTRKSKGTGLGLTICNELVNMHQGRIDIKSEVGQGTTVSVFLPIHRRQHEETSSD